MAKEILLSDLTDEVLIRFWSKVNKESGTDCWLWKESLLKGYGSFCLFNKRYLAHRISYLIHNKTLPSDLLILHKCDVKNCLNPAHLYAGTPLDNARDALERGLYLTGDKSWVRNNLDKIARGDRHGSKTHPEKILRGDNHPFRKNPSLVARGDRSGARLHPEKVPKGENHPCAKLTNAQVLQIRQEYIPKVTKIKDLAAKFNVSFSIVWNIVIRKTWNHI